MDHHRNPIRLRRAVENFQFLHAVQVVIGVEQLVRRVNLNEPNAKADDLLHIRQHVLRVARMNRSAGQQTLGVFLDVVDDPGVDFGSVAGDVGIDVIDEDGAIDADAIEMF